MPRPLWEFRRTRSGPMNDAPCRPMPIAPSTRRRGWVIPSVFCGLSIVVVGLAAVSVQRKSNWTAARPAARRDDPEALERRGFLSLAAGDADDAEHWWRLTLERDPQRVSTWVQLGRLALRRLDPESAVDPLERALAIDEENYPALHGLAAAHRLLGHSALARDYQSRAEIAQRALPPPTGGMGADAIH
jgi:tetratricopeptide (TPR) repeat protein